MVGSLLLSFYYLGPVTFIDAGVCIRQLLNDRSKWVSKGVMLKEGIIKMGIIQSRGRGRGCLGGNTSGNTRGCHKIWVNYTDREILNE